MMFLRKLLLAVIGTSGGLLVSGGVFTVLISVGLVPRFAGRTHTGKRIFLYEEMIVLGTLAGNLISVFAFPLLEDSPAAPVRAAGGGSIAAGNGAAFGLLILTGFFAGVFVGCLALAIAEMLNSIPIFARRIGFRHGLGLAVLSVALGKLTGSLLYFFAGFFAAAG